MTEKADFAAEVRRVFYTDESTVGALYINDAFQCYSLELPAGRSIPVGTYQLIVQLSPRFKRLMPHLVAVPGHSEILIHWGNTAKDTEGCILVGQTESSNFIGSSKKAFDKFFVALTAALSAKQTASITVRDGRENRGV